MKRINALSAVLIALALTAAGVLGSCAKDKDLASQSSAAVVYNSLPVQNDTLFAVNGVIFSMKKVEGGTFMMGSSADKTAQPVHEVKLSTFFIGETEVTQELYRAVMGSCPSSVAGRNVPVGNVTRYLADAFIARLSALTGITFCLPTEAQWEFAARGGNMSRGYTYSGSNNCSDVAVWTGSEPNPVASKQANELGLYDMSGNMLELCYDGKADYGSNVSVNPIGPMNTNMSVTRGGCYETGRSTCTVYYRTTLFYDKAWGYNGLRLAIW